MSNKFEVGGYFIVRPRLQEKKRLKITNDPVLKDTYDVFCFSGEQVGEWKEKMEDIDKKVNEGNCYIRLTDKLVKHEYEN